MDIFTLRKIAYRYPEQDRWALENIDLSIQEGEFVLLMGPSGCGKSTLARLLSGLIPDFYGGTIQGEILYKGQSMWAINRRELPQEVGFVFQDPENQMVMGEVEKEIAFGCENVGLDSKQMDRRVAETLSFLGLNELRHRQTHLISSGEKQKVAIGSILAMGPKIFILDEPTSQLDPHACKLFFDLMRRLHQEEGATIILIEHRYDEVFQLADRIIYLEEGKCLADSAPRAFVGHPERVNRENIPLVSQLFQEVPARQRPLTLFEGRNLLKNFHFNGQTIKKDTKKFWPLLMKVRNATFRYQSDQIDPTLDHIDLNIYEQECLGLLGENGAGKSTLLKLMAGLLSAQRGSVFFRQDKVSLMDDKKRARCLGLLTQNPNDYLFHETVDQELQYTMKNLGVQDFEWQKKLFQLLDIESLQDHYPRDLSCGQRQRVALASVLISKPKILLCDEPTRGLDAALKNKLLELFHQLREGGMSIVLVTQDVDFAAEFADRIAILSEGKILDEGDPTEVLDNNLFYSTRINKLFQGFKQGIVTLSQAKQLIKVTS